MVTIGGANPDYHVLTDADPQGDRSVHWGDMWHNAISRIVVSARANGLQPVDGPFGDIADPAGFEAQARRSAALGCEGKWVIHPSQLESVHRIFSPDVKEVEQARDTLDAMDRAKRDGCGVVSLNGKMIDLASVRQAENLLNKAEAISAKAS